MSLSKTQRELLEDKLALWRTASTSGPMDGRDYNRRAVEALEELWGDMDDYRERLHDLVSIDSEEWAIGGGPGFKERKAKAWARAREPFEP